MDQVGKIWETTSLPQRLIFVILFIGFALGFVAVAYWAREPEYGLLYGSLEQKEAAEIVAYLGDNNIPYQIGDKGSAVLVPHDRIHEARMSLAKNNLPGGGSGFELFDQVKFGTSNLTQKVNYRRALQGELSKAISQLDGVEWAKIQIVVPEQSLFIEEEEPSTASVIIKTIGGQRLKPGQIAGIRHIVSASVEGLSPDNVTIADSSGNLLSKTEDSTLAGMVSSQLEFRQKIENYHASKALSIVEKITGKGKAIVKVSAEIDFKHVDEKQTVYDPENRVLINQSIQTQSSEIPQMLKSEDEDGKVTSEIRNIKEMEESESTQYALGKTERSISDHVATIKRLTVAVLIDGTYIEEETEEGEKTRTYVPKTQAELDQIAGMVKQAIGIDETPPRNDKFEIQNVQFYSQPSFDVDEESIAKEKKKEFILAITKNASLLIAVIALIIFAARSLKRLSVAAPAQAGYATYEQPLELPEDIFGGESDRDKKRNEMIGQKRVEIRDSIIAETKGDPKTTSNLIRGWLREAD